MKKIFIIIIIISISISCFCDKKKLTKYEQIFIENSNYYELYIIDNDYKFDEAKMKFLLNKGNVTRIILRMDYINDKEFNVNSNDDILGTNPELLSSVKQLSQTTQINLQKNFDKKILFLNNPINKFTLNTYNYYPIWTFNFYFKGTLSDLTTYLNSQGFEVYKIY